MALEPLEAWVQRATRWHQRHPRTIVAALLASLGGFSAVAFGIAPLAPDAAQLPQQLIVERVEPEGLDEQLSALASLELSLTRSDLTRSSDSADKLLARLGVLDAAAATFLRSDPTARRMLQGRPGKMVQVQSASDGSLVELVVRYPSESRDTALTHFTRLTVSRIAGQWAARLETVPLAHEVRLGSGTIESSLFAAADEARIPDFVAIQMAEMFSADIDFHRELRKGDTFSVVYESLTADGEPITWNEGAGRVLAADFVNAGRRHQAVWFAEDGAKGGYFEPDGTSKRRTFLSSPMEFSRVTSGFAMRFHPILKTWRAHRGVDYAAPTGTPVRSVGKGVVEFAGWQNGYGKAVHVNHGNGRSTFYAHMSRIDVRKGQRVDQADRIGAVGSTGWSTGPHLHFEFRVNGAHQDPRRITKASEAIKLAPSMRPAFDQIAQAAQGKLRVAQSMIGVRVDAE